MRCAASPGAIGWCLPAALAVTMVAGCSDRETSGPRGPAGAGLELPEVSLPFLDGVEPAAREQLDAQRRALDRLRGSPRADREALAEAYGEMGRLCHAYGLGEVAARSYEAAESLAPEAVRWSYLAGVLAQEGGDFEQARTAFERVLARQRGHGPAALRLGETLLALQRPDEARRAFARARDAGERFEPAARFGLGRTAQALGEPEVALAELEAVLAARPEAGRARYPMALVLRQLGRLDEARRQLERPGTGEVSFPDPEVEALRDLPAGSGAHMRRGGEALIAGRLAEAEESFRRAVAVDPDYADARRNLALTLLRQGRAGEAAEQLTEGLRRQPDHVWLHFDLGQARLAGGDVEAAVESFRRATRLAPDFTGARFSLANALIRLGRWEEARGHLERLVEADPGDHDARYLLAMDRYQAGDRAAAEAELRRLLAENPGHAAAREGLAQILLTARRFAEAASEYAAVEPATGQSIAGGAVALSQAGRQREALALLEEGAASLPGDGAISLALARLLATCPDPALRDGRRALELAERLYRARPTFLHAEAVAMALAAAGEYSRAADWQRSLLAQVREAGQAPLAARLEADLRLYERGLPVVRPLG